MASQKGTKISEEPVNFIVKMEVFCFTLKVEAAVSVKRWCLFTRLKSLTFQITILKTRWKKNRKVGHKHVKTRMKENYEGRKWMKREYYVSMLSCKLVLTIIIIIITIMLCPAQKFSAKLLFLQLRSPLNISQVLMG